jgi:acyl-CoA synthetase (AMP-forming)/AMP-acid ligase II
MLDVLIERMEAARRHPALATPAGEHTYADLLARAAAWRAPLGALPPGSPVSVEGDYGPDTVAALLALTLAGHVAVPLSPDSAAQHAAFRETAGVAARLGPDGALVPAPGGAERPPPPLYEALRARGHPGLVLFSSGSSGRSKAAVHDLRRLLERYRAPRPPTRTLVFLLLDHIGGINTLFHTLASGGTVVVPAARTPAAVCEAIERHRVEVLPTSPTFLNLLLLSGEAARRDLSSLRLITYGTEAMPASTLARVTATFPGVGLLQTYGMTELGILRSRSRSSDSLWVRVGGEGYETKVVDGRLWVRAATSMLGYLDAPSPFDADGFLDTGDEVEVDGEWLRFVGRRDAVINVGGRKVYPAQVTSVLLEMDGVADAAVYAEPHPITGHIVAATVRLARPEDPREFKLRLRRFCAGRLAAHMVPLRVRLTDGPVHSARFKRVTSAAPGSVPALDRT